MGVNKAIRADDVSGLNIATTQFADSDAVTKDFQRVVINNSTDGTMAAVGSAGLKVDASGATVPVSIAAAVSVKPTDGTNAISKTFDLDSSGTTHEWNVGVGLRKKASGGSVELGTSSDPIRTDPTGTTTQPVSGTVTANLGTLNGAATAAKQPALGIAGSASADVISIQGVASMTAVKVDGSAVTQPVSWSSQTVTVTQGTAANLKVDISGTAANGTAIKVDGSAVTQPVSWSGQTVQPIPAATGGMSFFTQSLTSTKAQVKGSAGTLYGITAVNNGSALAYIQVFNKASASVTVGTTAPDYVVPVPAPSSGTAGAGIREEYALGMAFGTGITVACTTTRTGSTSATCDVNVNFI